MVLLEKIGAQVDALPEAVGRNGVDQAVRFLQGADFRKIQIRIRFIDGPDRNHPGQNRGGIPAGGKEEQKIRFVSDGKIPENVLFPGFITGAGGIGHPVARGLLVIPQDPLISFRGGIRSAEAGNGPERDTFAAGRRAQAQQQAENQSLSDTHGRLPFFAA